jgi:hypothetical protein
LAPTAYQTPSVEVAPAWNIYVGLPELSNVIAMLLL